MNLWTVENEKLKLRPHQGQARAWRSKARFVFMLAGTQGGKTAFLPWLLKKEIDRLGAGDYLAITASYDLFKLKFLPSIREVFERIYGIGRYWAGNRIMELRNPKTGQFEAQNADDDMWGRIILRSAESKGGLESATAKAAILDEVGLPTFTLDDWEAVQRRLSLSQGRVFAGTTLYNLGWLKSEVYDAWLNGDKDFDVIQFPSYINPAFPRTEYDRAKRKVQDWKFAMFYQGKFAKPATLIYGDFDESSMVVDDFPIPVSWPRVLGTDFGGANTGCLHLAESNQYTEDGLSIWYAYKCTLSGNKSTKEHVSEQLQLLKDVQDYEATGGAPSETQPRMDWGEAGLYVSQPIISDVESGIDRVIQLLKANRLRVFRSLKGVRDEFGRYQRKTDELGNPTTEILNKNRFHRMDMLRYAAISIIEGLSEIEIIDMGQALQELYQ
jgi:hypothetical protein